jgi:hypothetical protein
LRNMMSRPFRNAPPVNTAPASFPQWLASIAILIPGFLSKCLHPFRLNSIHYAVVSSVQNLIYAELKRPGPSIRELYNLVFLRSEFVAFCVGHCKASISAKYSPGLIFRSRGWNSQVSVDLEGVFAREAEVYSHRCTTRSRSLIAPLVEKAAGRIPLKAPVCIRLGLRPDHLFLYGPCDRRTGRRVSR